MSKSPIKLPDVQYEMLVVLSKKKRTGLTDYLIHLIEEEYQRAK